MSAHTARVGVFGPWSGCGFVPELGLAAFVLVNLAWMELWSGWETLPFHFTYVSVTLVYGVRAWRARTAIAAIVLVMLSTGALTLVAIERSTEPGAELVEVPLMTLMFLVMVWHVEVRRRAGETVEMLAQDRADALERERRFFADASHELLTPLTIARGYLDVLGRAASPTADGIRQTRRVVTDELRRMESVVADLLLIGKMDQHPSLALGRVSVAELLDAAAARWCGLSMRRWHVEHGCVGTISADRAMLERALDCLVDNAYRYTHPSDAIALSAHATGSTLTLSIEDTGEGIPEDAVMQLFDRFYRADTNRSRETGGAGLGLAIVRSAAEAHGGRVRVHSRIGEGSRFSIELPGFTPDPPPAITGRDAPPRGGRHPLGARAGRVRSS